MSRRCRPDVHTFAVNNGSVIGLLLQLVSGFILMTAPYCDAFVPQQPPQLPRSFGVIDASSTGSTSRNGRTIMTPKKQPFSSSSFISSARFSSRMAPNEKEDKNNKNKNNNNNNNNNDETKKKKKNFFVSPPPPEDQLTMSGDVASLFVYSFMDHSMNDLYINAVQAAGGIGESYNSGGAMMGAGELDSMTTLDGAGTIASSTALPVWYDAVHSTTSQQDQLLVQLAIPNSLHSYAPLISTAGMASIVMTSCWLLCGTYTGAFLFSNTLECHTTRMLWNTFITWLACCACMIALALGSDVMVHYFYNAMMMIMPTSMSSADASTTATPFLTMDPTLNYLESLPLGGLTKADADYIFDSLTVLVTWRFMVSSLLGGFSKK